MKRNSLTALVLIVAWIVLVAACDQADSLPGSSPDLSADLESVALGEIPGTGERFTLTQPTSLAELHRLTDFDLGTQELVGDLLAQFGGTFVHQLFGRIGGECAGLPVHQEIFFLDPQGEGRFNDGHGQISRR